MLYSELNEGKLTNTLAAIGVAANVANANVDMKPIHGADTRYGKTTPTIFQQRHGEDLDAEQYFYKLNHMPNVIDKYAVDSVDIEMTAQKITDTPDNILSPYGRKHANALAKYIVDAADKYDIDVNILLAILATETGFNQDAVSHTGVRSIAQITSTTFNDLQQQGHIGKQHTMNGIRTNVKDAIYAAADMINYYSTHMHNNIEMIFAEYNGGAKGGASPYRMYRQGKSKQQIINWMRANDCSEDVIEHFFEETIDYVRKCMSAYNYYLSIDDHL